MTNHNDHLKANCEKCFGLCCVALPFAASVDFAVDKDGGKPCSNLQSDFKCSIHKNLRGKGYKGCTVFECFGAGQKISQVTFNGIDWRKDAKYARKMYDAFPVMHQLHEMLWYLNEAILLQATQSIHKELSKAIEETERLSNLNADELMKVNIPLHRAEVNVLLLETSELVWKEMNSARKKRISHRGADLMGANLKKKDLQGANLRGAYLIAANLNGANLRGADLIGADLRDADIRGADFTNSIFLTQVQINAAKGDKHTKLPKVLSRPSHWSA
ncbi:pentapeptide repeat-containing protein [Bacillus sp. AR2-1]|uniref:pentapeptide repeat-containing protein n=1 Tax=Bacillus sp. AR2-1 TaxID=2217816 RepID=UPI0011F08891|nr:pentapeptide repeat-containing protein [Bacillus sp. AR2-1]KAA0779280.1 pentapeptide repeat-containing protein [Bacillus sp. AR2-1]